MNLIFDGITAFYRHKMILDHISFTVFDGSITALTGRNGAGKSTLINCLMGQKQDYRGQILLDGQILRQMDLRTRACSIACLPQILPQPHITVEELVAFGRTPYTPLYGVLSPTDREFVAQAMEEVGITALSNAFVDTLSGGELKKAFFAMTLAQNTPIVVLDEPTAHLDAASQFDFFALLSKLRKDTGKTFLIVMHELPEILQCADRIITIHARKVVFDGSPDVCLKAQIPEICFGVRVTGNKTDGYALRPIHD